MEGLIVKVKMPDGHRFFHGVSDIETRRMDGPPVSFTSKEGWEALRVDGVAPDSPWMHLSWQGVDVFTQLPVYLMNGAGDTIEAIRP